MAVTGIGDPDPACKIGIAVAFCIIEIDSFSTDRLYLSEMGPNGGE
jgi:hypothetical protein